MSTRLKKNSRLEPTLRTRSIWFGSGYWLWPHRDAKGQRLVGLASLTQTSFKAYCCAEAKKLSFHFDFFVYLVLIIRILYSFVPCGPGRYPTSLISSPNVVGRELELCER
jgi:hypothetical protein